MTALAWWLIVFSGIALLLIVLARRLTGRKPPGHDDFDDDGLGYSYPTATVEPAPTFCKHLNALPRYFLEIRHQDSGWEQLDGEHFDDHAEASRRAHALSRDAIRSGVIRIVDRATGKTLAMYSASRGGNLGHDR